MKNKLNQIIILIILVLCCSFVLASGESATRSFTSPANLNTDITVSLLVNPGTSTFYLIDEKVPTGFTVKSASDGGDITTNPGHIFWVVMSSAVTKTYTYTVNTGNTAGTFTFSGPIGFELLTSATTGGQNSIVISNTVIPVCTAGQTQSCTVGDCAGTKTCSNNAWGTCVKNDLTCGEIKTCSSGQVLCNGVCQSSCGDVGGCIPDNSCALKTLVGKTCVNNCGTTLNGKLVDDSGLKPETDNSMMYIIGGIVVVIILFVVTKKKK